MESQYAPTGPNIGLNAHLLSLDASYRAAGASRYIYKLLEHLPAADPGLRLHAYLADRRVDCAGWTYHFSRWPTRRPAARIVWEQAVLPIEARRHRLDLVHAPFCVGPLLTGRPMVVSIHDLSFYRYPELFRAANRSYLQSATRWSAQHARLVLASSSSTRSDVVEILGISPAQVAVVPLGVDEALRPVTDAERLAAFRQSHGLPERMILYLGTLEPRKNLPTLLAAYDRLRHRPGFPHKLVIAGGKGWYYDEVYAEVRRLGLAGHVVFTGYVPDAELPLWYSAADLFVYPSLYEGFGLPPLEALACGTPVVTTNVSSMPEVVGEAALVTPPLDDEALAAAMSRLLDDVDLAAVLRQRGLQRARELTWSRVAHETARQYRRVLGDQ